MATGPATNASLLRGEIAELNRLRAHGFAHVESIGGDPVIVYSPEDGRHGNFFDPAYAAILTNPAWLRRFEKIHAQGRAIPRNLGDPARKWRELDSCMSSDALLMNIFCTPDAMESPAMQSFLGVEAPEPPVFGWKARVPLSNGRFDRTEVDMRWGNLLVEAKLTETDFQTRSAAIVESYRGFDSVFDPGLLPRVEIRSTRRRAAIEFAEEYTQEWEEPAESDELAREFQQGLVTAARAAEPFEWGYAGYQLIRNVLAAHTLSCSFAVLMDARRPDLLEGWFAVLRAVRNAELRTRLKVFTWQELAVLLPKSLQAFLAEKYGIRGLS